MYARYYVEVYWCKDPEWDRAVEVRWYKRLEQEVFHLLRTGCQPPQVQNAEQASSWAVFFPVTCNQSPFHTTILDESIKSPWVIRNPLRSFLKANKVIQDERREPKGNRKEVGRAGGGNYIKTCRRQGKLVISLALADRSHCCFISGGAALLCARRLRKGPSARSYSSGTNASFSRTERWVACPADDLLQSPRMPQIRASQTRGPTTKLAGGFTTETHGLFVLISQRFQKVSNLVRSFKYKKQMLVLV